MPIQSISTALVDTALTWSVDWAWGVPLIVLTVLIHVVGLGVTSQIAVNVFRRTAERFHPIAVSVVLVGTTTLLATSLHALEAMIWAIAYTLLGAIPSYRMAMLYSLNAMTSYGHTNLELEDHWHLMGAMEALNGWLVFGLTTAFLFSVIDKVWITEERVKRKHLSDSIAKLEV